MSELKNLIITLSPHIVGISETWLKKDVIPTLQNYKIIRKDREEIRGGGLAFLIREDLKFFQLSIQNYAGGNLEVLGIKIAVNDIWANILLCYNPCKKIEKAEFDHYFQQIESPQLIMGDFNARHQFWNPSITKNMENYTGKTLLESFITQPFSLITPPDLPTRIDPYSGKASTLDLVFGSGVFSIPVSVSVKNNIGGDHLPVLIEYDNTFEFEHISRRPR